MDAAGSNDAATALSRRLLLVAALCCVSCGYRGALLRAPCGVAHVVVWPIEEPGVDGLAAPLTEQLRLQLEEAGLAVVAEGQQAEARVEGESGVRSSPGTTLQAVQVYNLDASAHFRLRDNAGNVLFAYHTSAQESFLPQRGNAVADQPLATEVQRHFALDRLAERLAAAFVLALQGA